MSMTEEKLYEGEYRLTKILWVLMNIKIICTQ